MALNSFSANQGTQTPILTDNTGGVNGTVIAVQKLDISAQGTAGTLWDGKVAVTAGTIGSLPNIPGGTLNNLASGTINSATVTGNVGISSGTINVSTISSLPNLPQGSINVTAGTIATLGTMGTLGLVNTVTTVSNITNGSIVVTAGTIAAHAITAATITAGTLTNLISGTINSATAVLNSGTINVATAVITTLPNLPQGSINVTAGTIATLGTMGTLGLLSTVTTVSNITNGTVRVSVGTVSAGTINTGTVNAGTINVGTFQINPLAAANLILHAGTSGTTGIGTLVTAAAIGAATALYPTGVRIVVISGTLEVALAFGSQVNGNQVIHHGLYPAGGGIAYSPIYPHGYGTTNSALTYQIISGAGTVSWDVDYFLHT